MKKIIAVMILAGSVLWADVTAAAEDGLDYGRQLIDTQRSQFQENVIQPLTTGSNMTSLDQKNNFKAQLSCSDEDKTAKLLTITYAGTDQISIIADVDLDLDGTNETKWTFSDVSGVCGNGIVKCNGAWDNNHCKYYQWQYNNNAKIVDLIEVPGYEVNTCFCTNNACPNVAVSLKDHILDTVLGSISQTIANNDPKYILTKTENTGQSAIGYAQSTKKCKQAYTGSQVGASMEQLGKNTAMEIEHDTNIGDSDYNFMLGQQNNITNSPIKADTQAYAQKQADYDKQIEKQQDIDPEHMKINNYGDGTYKDSAELADLGIKPDQLTYCKIKVWKSKENVYTDGTVTAEQNNDTDQYYIEVRECKNNVCIYDEANEEMLLNCAEDTNAFSEAVTQLEAINEASKDMVCSTK